MKDNAIEIYIHIPFCVKKCDYCDFLSFACEDETKLEYVEALIREIKQEAVHYINRQVCSVFIGGGTPSSLPLGCLKKIMDSVYDCINVCSDAEITIECNPGTITKDKLEEYKYSGINRLSVGLQSANDRELKLLGRIHDYETFEDNYKLAREAGFNNINIDLISGLPGQTVKDFEETIKKVISLNPEHISSYSLIVEEGTPFNEKYGEGKVLEDELPSEDEDRAIYHRTKEMLENAGYHQYEISNYAKTGLECKHNIGYWTRREYIGFGIGAASLYDNVRWTNTRNIDEYINRIMNDNDVKEKQETLSVEEQMEEYMFLGLRLIDGVDLKVFEDTFDCQLFDVVGYRKHTEKMINEGLLEYRDNRLFLTQKGVDLANYVMSGYIY